MSLERGGGATLGINSWKFNQGGFKDGGCVCVRACVQGCVVVFEQRGCKTHTFGI